MAQPRASRPERPSEPAPGPAAFAPSSSAEAANHAAWPQRIAASHSLLVGGAVLDARTMYRTNAVVLCHDTSPDPLFVYANEAAQALWGRTWAEFIGWPSRLTAPPAERHARASVLAEGGVVRGYEGVRVDRRGRLFRIHDAVVWPVMDEQGHVIGQAAMFDSWTLL